MLFFVVIWSGVIYFIGPEKIVEKVGVHNGYLLGFLISASGGVSVFSSGVVYATMTTLVIGGLNFIILGLAMGVGSFIGDMIMFYLGVKGKKMAEEKYKKKMKKYQKWIKKQPNWIVYLILYFYVSFVPMPNDLLLIPLGLAGYHYKQVIPSVLLGNLTFMLLLGYFSLKAINFI